MPTKKMTDDERRAFLESMTGSGRRDFSVLRNALTSRDRGLVWYLDFGRTAERLHEGQEPVSRRGGLTRLVEALGCSRSLLTKARDFATTFSDDEVRELASEGVTWAHATAAASVPGGKATQMKWMRRATREGWAAPRLQREVRKKNNGPLRKGGRPRSEARSYGVASDLLAVARMTAEWLRQHEQVWTARATGLLAQMEVMPAAEYGGTLLAQVTEAEARLGELAIAAAALEESLRAMRVKAARSAMRGRKG